MENNNRGYDFKIVILGDGATGKTTYVNQVKEGNFIRTYVATQGAEVSEIQFYLKDGRSIVYQVWDTAGQEIYGMMSDVYYLGADAAIIMYNVTSRSTFTHVRKWLNNLRDITGDGGRQIPVIVCGNMVDLADRKVTSQQVISELGTRVYKTCEISAKTSYQVEQPFLLITRALLNDHTIEFGGNLRLKPDSISLDEGMSNAANIQKARSMDLPDQDF